MEARSRPTPPWTFQELLLAGTNGLDQACEVTCVYDMAAPGLMYAGPIVRYDASTGTYLMVKVQDNGGARNGWDTIFVYYYDGTRFTGIGVGGGNISPPSLRARVRMQAIDIGGTTRVDIGIDADMDGVFEILRSGTTTRATGQSGEIGVNGYRNAIVDDLSWYNRALVVDSLPTVGSTGNTLTGSAGPGDGFVVGMSASATSGFPALGVNVPIDFDPLLATIIGNPAFFPGLIGVANPQGQFTATYDLPNLPSLSGATLYACTLTIGVQNGVSVAVPITIQ